MLLKIREKSQGVFSWVILLLICVPFALWGIQNYLGGGSEAAVASVGDRDFYQNDVNRAYAQYTQSLAGMNFDEKQIKKQSLAKLIRDEVLLQYVEDEGLVVTDKTTKDFVHSLEYFQKDGKFDNDQYKALLKAQRMTSKEFINRIKKALVMEQYQRGLMESSFATQGEIESFFRIQNQMRDIEIISIALDKDVKQPTDEVITKYYQQHTNSFLTKEQTAIEYIELSLDNLAKQVSPTNEQLETYYQDNKERYAIKERRKISHILFAFTKDNGSEENQLQRALKAKQQLQNIKFTQLAAKISDDKLTASKGGDLGLFTEGDMEEAFEKAATALQLNEVSDPVKSAFGYHLIKVTELVASGMKPFNEIKDQISQAYKRLDAESTFYELGEMLTNVSYENPDSLQAVAGALDIDIKKTGLFGKQSNQNQSVKDVIVAQSAIVNAAFSEDVLKGNNSEPIELGSEKLVVLRMLEYKPAETKQLENVKAQIIATLINDKAKIITKEKAQKVKTAVEAGQTMQMVAKVNGFKVKKYSALSRSNGELTWQVNQSVFKAAKPVAGKPTVITVVDPSGSQTVISLTAVTEGVMTESDKAKLKLAESNLAKAFGQAEFNAALNSLEAKAEITINVVE